MKGSVNESIIGTGDRGAELVSIIGSGLVPGVAFTPIDPSLQCSFSLNLLLYCFGFNVVKRDTLPGIVLCCLFSENGRVKK